MECTLPVLLERQMLTIRGRDIVLGQTTLDEVLAWFGPDATLDHCNVGCHASVTIPTPLGECGLRFAPNKVDLVSLHLSTPVPCKQVLAGYAYSGVGQEQIHRHTKKTHITFPVIGVDLSLDDDRLVSNIGYSTHFT